MQTRAVGNAGGAGTTITAQDGSLFTQMTFVNPDADDDDPFTNIGDVVATDVAHGGSKTHAFLR